MKRHLLLALPFLALAVPAFAEPSCPGEGTKLPMWQAAKTFEEAGGEIMQMKTNSGGCYEVYGRLDGKKYEVFYDPMTGVELDRIEA